MKTLAAQYSLVIDSKTLMRNYLLQGDYVKLSEIWDIQLDTTREACETLRRLQKEFIELCDIHSTPEQCRALCAKMEKAEDQIIKTLNYHANNHS